MQYMSRPSGVHPATRDLDRRLRGQLVAAKTLVRGLATFIPSADALLARAARRGGDARYCYTVWLRHLVHVRRAGTTGYPQAVAELGPGESLGAGLAALLGGAEIYYALDVEPYADALADLRVFDQLVALYRERAPIPGDGEFPDAFPRLPSYEFPSSILDEGRLRRALADERIAELRRSIREPYRPGSRVRYIAPYSLPDAIPRNSVDLVFSQAALYYVVNLPELFQAVRGWLAPRGAMSHQIDFGAVGTAKGWNRHWTYSDVTWRLMRGRRPSWPTRAPHSTYLRAVTEAGFEVLVDLCVRGPSEVEPEELARAFRHLSNDDLTTRGALIIARRNDEARE